MKQNMLVLLCCLITMTYHFSAFADIEDDLEMLESDFYTQWEGDINLGFQTTKDHVNLSESYIGLNAYWGDKVLAYISTKLEHAIRDNTLTLNPNFKLSEFIREAYVKIYDINGSSVALVVGKQQVAFGQNYHEMPIWTNNPLQNLQEIEEVMGFTVELPQGLFGLFDFAELSVFETQSGDLAIGEIDGISIRLSRQLTENWLLTASHAELGNNYLRDQRVGKESRSSIGLIGTSEDGYLVGWLEGMIFTNNPQFPGSHYAITLGSSVKVSENTKVIAEFTYISKLVYQISLGLDKKINNNFSFGPELRYTKLNNNAGYLTLGINLNAKFSTGFSDDNYYSSSEDTDETDDK